MPNDYNKLNSRWNHSSLCVTLRVPFLMEISKMLWKNKMVAGEISSQGEQVEPVPSKGWRDSSNI